MNIVFRVDASTAMGSGHVMRTLTLADALKNRDCSTFFICRELDGNLISYIKKRGHRIVSLQYSPDMHATGASECNWLGGSLECDRDDTLKALDVCGTVDWLVVDNYGIDLRWHKAIRGRVDNIMVIDDLADRNYDCDILLDQTFERDKSDYIQLVPDMCRCLLGTDYALLRPQFKEWREEALVRRKTFFGRHPRILVSMGGTDPNNLTSVVLSALQKIAWGEPVSIEVVLGQHAPHLNSVKEQAKRSILEIKVYQNIYNMAEIMSCTDLAIGTGGTTSWERCCLALPTVLVVDAENQELISKKLSRVGAITALHQSESLEEEVKTAVEDILFNHEHYSRMSRKAATICDGCGVSRVVDMVCENV